MCTASWFLTADGYELFFNRDERLTRGAAEPPREEFLDGVRYLAPRDLDAGGTWIAANDHGLTLALLNAWQVRVEPPATGFRSRGLLVRDLAGAASAEEVVTRLRGHALERYQGFTLAVFEPGRLPGALGWDGKRLREEEARAPLVSSSADLAGALAHRRAAFARLEARTRGAGLTGRRAAFEDFHRDGAPGPGPLAVCMRREDARTVSTSHVAVDAAEVRLRYAPGPPDETPFGPALALARRAGRP